MNWTAPQRDAITDRSRHVLCSAAAGSGKTAVLAQRVLARLVDPEAPVGIDRLLVVTFTRAAAAEMRRRVTALLREAAAASPHLDLERQLWLLPRADITTIHGFCERTVRRHFLEVGTDPSFTVLDAGDGARLIDEAAEEVLERGYEAGRGDPAAAAAFTAMVERYGGRHLDGSLRGLALALRRYAQSMPDPEGWLAAAVRGDVEWEAARAMVRRVWTRCLRRTDRASALAPAAYVPALASDRALFAQLLRAADGPWDAMAEGMRSASLVRLAQAKDADPVAAERARALRQANREALAGLAAGPCGRPEAALRTEAEELADHLRPLAGVVHDLGAAYAEKKARFGALDFDDLEHHCLDVVRGPAGPALAARYDEVLVDESQDLSPVQDELISRLVAHGPALFSVGDARQSIYGFRQAEPRRFAARERRFATGGGRLISLPHNFRSRAQVVAAVNFVFSRLFRADGADVPDSALEPMEAGASYPPVPPRAPGQPGFGPGGGATRLVLLEGDTDDEGTALEREAAEVARQVGAWLAGGLVHDTGAAREARYRPARPGDVAVLLRAPGGTAPLYADALRAAGIPCWAPDQGQRAHTVEGRSVTAWWRTLENPQQDIPLAATLLGPFGRLSPEELAEVRLAAPTGSLWHALRACAAGDTPLAARAAAWLRRLEGWRTAARQGAWAELLARTLDESGYAAHVGALPGGEERQRNLEWCLDRCRDADRLPVAGIPKLIAHIEDGGGDTLAEAAAAAGDAVRVLSIHGSKGLEFPFVLVAGLGRRFHGQEGTADVLAQRDLGVGARWVDPERRLRWPTLTHTVVAARRRAEARAEELRVLYVAMTRAREGLCLMGTVRDLAMRAGGAAALAEALRGEPSAGMDLEEGTCYLDWLLPVLAAHGDVAPVFGAHAGIAARGAPDPGGSRWEAVLHLGPVAAALVADELALGANGPPALAGTEAVAPVAERDPKEPGAAAAVTGPLRETTETAPADAEALCQTLARLEAEHAWTYPWTAATRLPAKLAVSEWAVRPVARDEEPNAAWEPGRRAATPGLARPEGLEAGGRPSPADVGAATHAVLRHVDLTGPCDRPALEAHRADLVARALVAAPAAAGVDVAAVARFLAGPLGRRLRAQPRAVWREWPFSLRLDAGEAYRGEAADGEWVLVQGVVDALLIDEGGVLLLDYKTDAAGAAAAGRHLAQIGLYARAATAAWGRPVAEAWLCFLATGEDVRVPTA